MLTPLFDLRASDRGLFGGKAALLGEMNARGISVPNGIAISVEEFRRAVAYIDEDEFVGLNNLDTSGSSVTTVQRCVSKSHNYENGISKYSIKYLVEAVTKMLSTCSIHGELIVRSSAVAEDGLFMSFAGQFLSVRCNHNYHDIEAAIKKVWVATFEPHISRYVEVKGGGIPSEPLEMAIVVQEYMEFDISGVLFSRHPVSNLHGWMLVELVEGSPSNLVDGSITPSRCRIRDDGRKILWEHKGPGSSRLEFYAPERLTSSASLMREAIGKDVDIEWGARNGEFVALQCRPVTTVNVR